MDDYETQWDINLRANLRLWPAPAPNIERLAGCFGQKFDEDAFLDALKRGDASKAPGDTRAVRNTFEALAYAGLAYRTGAAEDTLVPSPLGMSVLSFLLASDGRSFANEANRHLLAPTLVRALSLVVEIRAIWMLFRAGGNVLTNEELNRLMARVERLSDVEAASAALLLSRETGDPSAIGDRIYGHGQYGTSHESDQRKAMNPHFLLAGGGGWFIDLQDANRCLLPWAVEMVDAALEEDAPLFHASTDREVVLRMSTYGAPPIDPRWSLT
jgi:hypothetical protein